MNQNPTPRKPNPPHTQQPPRRPDHSGLGQPVRRTNAPGAQRPAAPRQPMANRPLIHPARTARRRRQKKVILAVFVVIILTICMLIGLIFSELATAIGTMVERTGNDKKQEQTTTAAPVGSDSDGPVTGGSVSEPVGMTMTTVQVSKEDVSTGNLQLINAENAYIFPTSVSNIVNIFDNRAYVTLEDGTKSRAYKVRNSNQSLDRTALDALNTMLVAFYEEYKITDMLVTWAYRSLADQQSLYDLYVADYPGYSDAQIKQQLRSEVDTPGYSEHHLGTGVDLKLYTDAGITYTLDDEPGYLSWLTENCWKYGFVLRYPADKVSVTGISYDPHHFRYVEIPHAYYMMSNGLCLEEYLDELARTTSPSGDHLTIEVDGGSAYEVYYVAVNGNTMDLPVPADYPYTVSGDNRDGFIVTVTMD